MESRLRLRVFVCCELSVALGEEFIHICMENVWTIPEQS